MVGFYKPIFGIDGSSYSSVKSAMSFLGGLSGSSTSE